MPSRDAGRWSPTHKAIWPSPFLRFARFTTLRFCGDRMPSRCWRALIRWSPACTTPAACCLIRCVDRFATVKTAARSIGAGESLFRLADQPTRSCPSGRTWPSAPDPATADDPVSSPACGLLAQQQTGLPLSFSMFQPCGCGAPDLPGPFGRRRQAAMGAVPGENRKEPRHDRSPRTRHLHPDH